MQPVCLRRFPLTLLTAEQSPACSCTAPLPAKMCQSCELFQSELSLSDANLQSLHIHAGFNSALKPVGGRCLNGNKAPHGFCGTRSQPGCNYGPRRCFTGSKVNPELNPKLLRPAKSGRAPIEGQVSVTAVKLCVVKSKALVWRDWKGAADGKSSRGNPHL